MSIEKCKYCGQSFDKFDCTKLKQRDGFFGTLINIWLFIETPFVLLFMYLFRNSIDQKLEKKGIVYTCINEDCIGYADGCDQIT